MFVVWLKVLGTPAYCVSSSGLFTMATASQHAPSKINIAIIGSGLVGKSWAMLFACSGYSVKLYDVSPVQQQRALQDIEAQLSALYKQGGQRSDLSLNEVKGHVKGCESLEDCVFDAYYIQESVPENKDLKRDVWKQIDDIIQNDDVIFGSSTSAILPSLLSDHLKRRQTFMVAHPANPPLFNPMVELVPAPWTNPAAVGRAKTLMESIGQVPIVLNKEIDGFVQARIQASLFNAAWQLIKEGYVDVEGVETALHDGLGAWYAFMGPYQAEQLNSEGFVDCCNKYGDMVADVQHTFPQPEMMQGPAAEKIAHALTQWTPVDRLGDRCHWRDRRMVALLQLKRRLDGKNKKVA